MVSLPMAGSLEPDELQGPFQPKPFYDSMILFHEDTTFLLKPGSALASVKGCDRTQFKCIRQYNFHLGCFPIANIVQKLFIPETGKL